MSEQGYLAIHGPADADDLLLLVGARPQQALAQAREVLAGRPGPLQACIAHQVVGSVLREWGDVDAAVRELRTALRLARMTASPDREADVLATLGIALIYAGRTGQGLAALDRAQQLCHGGVSGRVLLRRGGALWTLGRNREALEDLRHAVALLHRAGDAVWEARARTARAHVHLAFGSTDRADADFAAADRLYASTSQELESAYAVHNRALVAFRSGDLPSALSHLDEAASRYKLLRIVEPDLSIDRCHVLLAAGLPRDALDEADAAIAAMESIRGDRAKRAELLLAAATAALASDEPREAMERAQKALRLFRSQQRHWWRAHAEFALLHARYSAGMTSVALLGSADRTAARLDELGSAQAPQAHLLAGRLALALGRVHDADRHLATAARSRRHGPALSRAVGWLAEALRAQAASDPRRLLGACRRGLDILDEHRLTLGASELRAQASAQGAELAILAQRQAAAARSPRLLLSWSERWRATALAVPAVRPTDDRQLGIDLAALRDVTTRAEKARSLQTSAAALMREQVRLEEVVRARAMQAPGGIGAAHAGLDIAALLHELGQARLVQIIDVDGTLQVLSCGAGRVRRFGAGRSYDAVREAEFVRFGLRRLARQRPNDDPIGSVAMLEAGGGKLQAALLGQAARDLGDGPVVIIPPARFHAVPWALLPSLRDRVISVAPSAGAWMRARAIEEPRGGRVVVVCGPDLDAANVEVPAVAAIYTGATVLGGGSATAGRVLEAIDGAWLAHVAAHGRFRADSPLFSSLLMDDGPLTVYDFERLRRAPYRLVLPSCDSGVLAPAGADELLGLVASLLPLGTAGILASVVQLNDSAAASLMPELHRWLASGRTLAESLLAARRDTQDDPLLLSTGLSLLALGAG